MAPSTTVAWDDSIAHEYEKRIEPFTASFTDQLLEPLHPTSGATKFLDVGCGTGCVSIAARKKGFQVTATDVSKAMVDRLERRWMDEFPCEDSLDSIVADGMNVPEAMYGQFDAAVGSFSVIFFPDPKKGLEEIHSCLRAGGAVAISAWGSKAETPAFQVFPDAVQEAVPSAAADSKPKRITGSPEALRELLTSAGFSDIHVVGPVSRDLCMASAEAFYDRFAKGSPNIREIISKLDKEEVQRLKTKVVDLATARGGGHEGVSEIAIPSCAYFAYGKK